MPALIVLPVWGLIFYKQGKKASIIFKHSHFFPNTHGSYRSVASAMQQLYIISEFPKEAYCEYKLNAHFWDVA